ncbi:hypothetical protein EU555_23180 [Methylobacterium nonmethylotrophicum]|uniref:Uncharacterized protein n=2 Tax=Methylobacterium nonmethylotrophicum TaxID=1141884 RepID=A0A4Z0NJZ7_9HYPH|nr:hypothetical protein EU555_23180 [Methylobacterium nonmethylotrophicum]
MPVQLRSIMRERWSIETSSLWLPENPARGQCDVTSLIVHDLCGGDILKNRAPDGWHFYNWANGERHDLTDSQFSFIIDYSDLLSRRDDALAGTALKQRMILRNRVVRRIEFCGVNAV